MTGALLDLGEEKPGTPRLEGVGVARRGLARLIDMGVLQVAFAIGALHAVALSLLLQALFGPASYAAMEGLMANQATVGSRLLDLSVGLLGLIAMHTFCEGLHGSTIGKRLCGITVVSDDGGAAGMLAALKRSLGFLVDQMFFGLVGAHFIHNDPKAQRLGDQWADTMVVRIDELEPSSRRSTGRLVLATVVGLAAAAGVAFLSFGAQVAYGARAAAADRVKILDVVLLPDQEPSPGGRANFAVRVRHDLSSVPRGTLGLLVLGEEDFTPTGGRTHVIRGGGTVTLRERLSVPSVPAAPGSFVVRLAVGLYPALNEEAPSAFDAYDVEMIACAHDEPNVLCVRGRSRP